MDLGLALAAGNAFFKEQNAQDIRDREKSRFDWERQRAEAEMSVLGDKTEADRSGYKLRSGQNAAGLELLPGDTANRLAEQELRGGELAGAKERQPEELEAKSINAGIDLGTARGRRDRQPTEEATKNVQADMGLAQAQAEQEMQPGKITQAKNANIVATELSQVDVNNLPRMVAEKVMKSELSATDGALMVAAKISDLIDAGDANSIITLLNAQKKYSTDPKVQALPDVASVSKAQDANGTEFLVLKDAKGATILSRPIDIYRQAKTALAPTDVKAVDAGDTLVTTRGGKVVSTFTAPESQKSLNSKQGPLERDVNYYVREFGLTKEQAIERINSTKGKSREDFVRDAVQKEAIGNETPEQLRAKAAKWSKFYDDVKGTAGPKSNSGAKSTIPKPQILDALGL